MISYRPLHVTLAERSIKKSKMYTDLGICTATAAKISKNEYVSMRIIDKICDYLDCSVSDVMEHITKK